jgi:hypothetical protein
MEFKTRMRAASGKVDVCATNKINQSQHDWNPIPGHDKWQTSKTINQVSAANILIRTNKIMIEKSSKQEKHTFWKSRER